MRQDISQDGDAWHEFRAGGIGSSDIAAIMGKSPYKTAADVYYEKCGLSEQFQTAAMKRGKEKEAEALDFYNYDPLGRECDFSPAVGFMTNLTSVVLPLMAIAKSLTSL